MYRFESIDIVNDFIDLNHQLGNGCLPRHAVKSSTVYLPIYRLSTK